MKKLLGKCGVRGMRVCGKIDEEGHRLSAVKIGKKKDKLFLNSNIMLKFE